MECVQCGKSAFTQTTRNSATDVIYVPLVKIRIDKYLGPVCDACDGQYATLVRKNQIMKTGIYV